MKVLLTIMSAWALGLGAAACGESECDKLADCCEAFRSANPGSTTTCSTPPDGTADATCEQARSTFVALVGAFGGATVPDACR